MAYVVGIDEAGYSPNLGPLVVAASLWQVPDTQVDFYDLLKDSVCADSRDNRIQIADSKVVFNSARSLESLERPVCAVLGATKPGVPSTLSELIARGESDLLGELLQTNGQRALDLDAGSEVEGARVKPVIAQVPTDISYSAGAIRLPMTFPRCDLILLTSKFVDACQCARLSLRKLTSIVIFPHAFNSLAVALGNKSNLLSALSMRLANRLLAGEASGDTRVIFDKHGGRNRYASMIRRYLTTQRVTAEYESTEVSRYRWNGKGKRVAVSFMARGESQLPVALASMYAKYVRELCMEAFNRYWQLHLPGVRPTRGYPADAKRFRRDVGQKAVQLGISNEEFWRNG